MSLNKFYKKLWNIKESVKKDIKKLGDYMQFITPVVFLVYIACFGDTTLGRAFCVAYIAGTIIQVLLKALFNNPRPREVDGTCNPNLDLDWSVNEGDSFPSGHTMSAMVGGVFWFEISWWMGIIGVILGLVTGLSRIIAKAHWLRDVLTSSVVAVILYVAAYYYLH